MLVVSPAQFDTCFFLCTNKFLEIILGLFSFTQVCLQLNTTAHGYTVVQEARGCASTVKILI